MLLKRNKNATIWKKAKRVMNTPPASPSVFEEPRLASNGRKKATVRRMTATEHTTAAVIWHAAKFVSVFFFFFIRSFVVAKSPPVGRSVQMMGGQLTHSKCVEQTKRVNYTHKHTNAHTHAHN